VEGVGLDITRLLEMRTWRAFDVDDEGRVLAGWDDSGSVQLVELAGDRVTPLTALPGAGLSVPGPRWRCAACTAGRCTGSTTITLDAVLPGGQFDMQQLLAQAMSAQQELASAEVTGQAGNGLVTVKVTGEGEVTALTIDPKVVDPDDVETLQDLIVGALRDAHGKLRELAMKKIGPLGDLGLPGF
jgi:DNA-binding YbaB/EbfC family protein